MNNIGPDKKNSKILPDRLIKEILPDIEDLSSKLIESNKILIICGPTGIGKTNLGINIARILNTNIISVDSMQVYIGMDIGTDKVDTLDYGITQYMTDIFEPDHELTVMEFSNLARNIIEKKFLNDAKIPLMVGGSGLYIKSIIDDIDKGPGKNKEFRDKLEKDIDINGLEKYYRELSIIDKDYAQKISKNDRRRIIRALEVYNLTGNNFSSFQKTWSLGSKYNVCFIGLYKERDLLYKDIEDRVENMFNEGLIDEVRALKNKGFSDCQSLKQAVGYKEVLLYLKKNTSLESCKDEVKKNSRRLAKKQMTWFRKDNRINWLRVDNYDNMFDLIKDSLKVISKEL